MIYEEIIKKYKKDIQEGRKFLFDRMQSLSKRNPLLKHENYTYTKEDILVEMFLIADKILQKNVSDNKKISRLWYLFNK